MDQQELAEQEMARALVSEELGKVFDSAEDSGLILAHSLLDNSGQEAVVLRQGWFFKNAKSALRQMEPALVEHVRAAELNERAFIATIMVWSDDDMKKYLSDKCAQALSELGAEWVLAISVRKRERFKQDDGKYVGAWVDAPPPAFEKVMMELGAIGPVLAGLREDRRLVESDLTDGLIALAQAAELREATESAKPDAVLSIGRLKL